MTQTRRAAWRAALILLLTIIQLGIFQPAGAQTLSAAAVIAEVNTLRASQGLAPYKVDSGLMAIAQEHSEYQARIGQGTHTHSNGQSPAALGLQENVANGSSQFLTSSLIVYQIWADAIHMHTMTAYAGGSVGVGVASSGNTSYVTLDVRPSGAASSSSASSGSTGSPSGSGKPASQPTSIALAALTTNTPRPDGSIVHEVGYGQSLWSIAIAYGVKINEIRALNGLAAEFDGYLRRAEAADPQGRGDHRNGRGDPRTHADPNEPSHPHPAPQRDPAPDTDRHATAHSH